MRVYAYVEQYSMVVATNLITDLLLDTTYNHRFFFRRIRI